MAGVTRVPGARARQPCGAERLSCDGVHIFPEPIIRLLRPYKSLTSGDRRPAME